MEKYIKRADALVLFSLLLLGYFAAHTHGNARLIRYLLHRGEAIGIDEVGAPSPAEEVIMRRSGAQCAQNNPHLPCKDNKCFCCIGG
ncbi:unnamed protein product [Miscanthus lutarioriparius]|uniref:Meg domain-containing protein n=1 Tax=Miscanthus lutarioriparius TaxID=422564 RepID=A0A811NF29_9POAL|nr:unnamed protein product [Miscanthus lutarioriparius]